MRREKRVGSQTRSSQADEPRRPKKGKSIGEESDLERAPATQRSSSKGAEKEELDVLLEEGPMGELFEEQIELDQAQEFCLEAHCLLNGHGIGQQLDDALHWYKLSIDKGEKKAMLALAQMSERGHGMRVDLNSATEYY